MARTFKHRVKRERPGWWTPEGVLERLQNGAYVLELCQKASDEAAAVGVTVAPATLRGEVAKWCETASMGEPLRAALALWKRNSSGELVLSKAWHDDFLSAMEVCDGNAEKASKMAGIGYGVVLAVLDPRNKCHDREFAEQYRIAEAGRYGRIREKYMDLAENGEGKLAAMAQQKLSESGLPFLHAQKQEVQVSGRVEHGHEHEHRHMHLHAMTPEMAREVALASQQRVRRITSNREPVRALPSSIDEGTVIDLRPVDDDKVILRKRAEVILGSRGVAALEGAIEEAMDKAMPIIRDSIDSVSEKPS